MDWINIKVFFEKYKILLVFAIILLGFTAIITSYLTNFLVKPGNEKFQYTVNLETIVVSEKLEQMFDINSVTSVDYIPHDISLMRYRGIIKKIKLLDKETKELVLLVDSIEYEIINENLKNNSKTELNDNEINYFYPVKSNLKINKMLLSLENSIKKYREFVLKEIEDTFCTYYKDIDRNLHFYSDEDNPYLTEQFYIDKPAIRTIILLSDLRIRVLESSLCYWDFVVNSYDNGGVTPLKALVSASKKIVLEGDLYDSEIYLGINYNGIGKNVFITYDSPFYDSVITKSEIIYSLNDSVKYEILPVNLKDGKSIHKKLCNKTGIFEYGGLINFTYRGQDLWIPFRSNYYVKK